MVSLCVASQTRPGRARLLVPGLALILLVLGSTDATAQNAPVKTKGIRLAVVELDTPPTMMGLGGQVVQQVLTSAKTLGYLALPPDQVREKLGSHGAERVQKCEGRPRCVAGELGPLGVERAVVGRLSRDDKSYLVKLALVDVASGEVLADVDRSILIASRRFKQDVAEAVPRLLRGQGEARGTLVISANAKNVTVWVEGEQVGKTPVTVQLKPGKHEVRLEKKNYLPIRRLVTVEADQTTNEAFRLILEPGAVDEDERPIPALAATKEKPAETTGLHIRLPAWIAFGTAAASAGAASYFGIVSQRTERELQTGYDPEAQTYSGTRAQALTGRSQARAANILYGVAGAAAVTGVLLTVFDVGGEAAPVTTGGTATPSGASIFVEGRF